MNRPGSCPSSKPSRSCWMLFARAAATAAPPGTSAKASTDELEAHTSPAWLLAEAAADCAADVHAVEAEPLSSVWHLLARLQQLNASDAAKAATAGLKVLDSRSALTFLTASRKWDTPRRSMAAYCCARPPLGAHSSKVCCACAGCSSSSFWPQTVLSSKAASWPNDGCCRLAAVTSLTSVAPPAKQSCCRSSVSSMST